MSEATRSIEVPAIRVRQGEGREVFSFAIDGKLLCKFAAVSRIRSGGVEDLQGYQRAEVLSHISEIRRYLEGEAPILPNAIVVALTPSVVFTPDKRADQASNVMPGSLRITWDPAAQPHERPAWIVDGQQRLAAIREAQIGTFPICVTAFITADEQLQREQFLLLNNTKPLPKSLIYELLPGTGGGLPAALAKKRLPAALTRMLNESTESPFRGRIKLATNPAGVVRDNSVMRMIEHSLTDGALLRIRLGEGDDDNKHRRMLKLVNTFWGAVRDTWPEAWRLPPRKSRLLHGAGVVSLGFVMDEMAELHQTDGRYNHEQAKSELAMIADRCAWTSGRWPFGEGRECPWNEIQNTSHDVNLLSNFLLREYRMRVRPSLAAAR